MTAAEKHIRTFNALNGKRVGKADLARVHCALKKDIDSKRIDAHMPFGVECIHVEKRLASAIEKMNGHKMVIRCEVIDVDKVLSMQKRSFPDKKKVVKQAPKPKAQPDKKSIQPKPAKKATPISPELKGLGFITADQAPEALHDTWQLPGEIGKFLGEQQQYRCQIIIEGDKHSSKSEMAKQIADAAIDFGFNTALVDWEQGGLSSKDTVRSIERNVKPDNRKRLYVSADIPTTQNGLEKLTEFFEVIIVDSGTKVNAISNTWLDELRVKYPQTIWVMLMQRNAKGTTRGGTSAGYNAPVIIFTHRPDKNDQLKNYATIEKNRGNDTSKAYLIAQKRIVDNKPSAQ